MKNPPDSFRLFDTRRQYDMEDALLAPYAFPGRKANATRLRPETEHPYRKAFSRDRDRIIHSRAFRRLKHKRQVFLTNVGDHYRTRLTHTMEVSQLSRSIARALGLNEDLTEAIALGHDLGHTPFGHLGETVLDQILRGKFGNLEGFPAADCGGFKHNYQSLRVVDHLEMRYSFPGLNLTAPVREGILKHTRLRRHKIRYPQLQTENLRFEQDCASTLEGQVVAIADEIAQRTHDLEDGIRAGLAELEEVRRLEIVQKVEEEHGLRPLFEKDRYLYRNRLIHRLIDLLVNDVIQNTLERLRNSDFPAAGVEGVTREYVGFSRDVDPLQKELNKFIYECIIYREEVRKFDDAAQEVMINLFRVYSSRPELLPRGVHRWLKPKMEETLRARVICDHIAGMTDPFAVSELKRFVEQGFVRLDFDIDSLQLDWMR